MSHTEIGPVSLSDRIEVVDVLRGLAIGGILIGNMQWLSGYGMMPDVMAAQQPLLDRTVDLLIHIFVEGKFYSIFSLLFGFGFAIQITRAAERGDERASVFKRRLFWLFVIGVLHSFLLWAGDILAFYALVGFVLLLFRKKSDESLLKWSFALLAVPIVTYAVLWTAFLWFAPPGTNEAVVAGQEGWYRQAVALVSQGSYPQIMTQFNLRYVQGRWMGLLFEMRFPKVLAMFLLGFYVYRRGFLQDVSRHLAFIRRLGVVSFLVGVAGNIGFALLSGQEAPMPPTAAGFASVVLYSFSVPALALFYASAVVLLWQTGAWRTPLGVLAPVGRMALTNYIMQSVIAVTLFYGFGFGLFGRYGAAASTAIALAIFAFQIIASGVWLRFFRFGPLEWIWRQLTYGRRMHLRHDQTATAEAS